MKRKQHPLQILEDTLPYFRQLTAIQSDPSIFNSLSVQIENRIETILQYIKKDAANASAEERGFAFQLLKEHILVWEQYFRNHPWYSLKKK